MNRRSRKSNFLRQRTFERLERRLLLTGNDCAPVITQQGSTVIVVGRATDDVVELQLGETQHLLNFSGNEYVFDASEVNEIRIGGGFGNNSITIRGSDLDDRGTIVGQTGTLTSDVYAGLSFSFQQTTLIGGAGNDYAEIFGSDQADSLQALPESSTIVTPSVTLKSEDFERIDTYGRGGNDVGQIYGTTGDDQLIALDDYVALFGGGITRVNRGFERIDGFGRGGNDFARFYDSTSDDTFVSTSRVAYLQTANRLSYAKDFAEVEALSINGGSDQVHLTADAASVETVTVSNTDIVIEANSYSREAQGFDSYFATSQGTNDIVEVLELSRGDAVTNANNLIEVIGPDRNDRFDGFAQLLSPTDLELFLQSLEGFLPQSLINAAAARIASPPSSSTQGTNGEDVFVGTSAAEEFLTLGDNDEIFSMGGNDWADGGGGNDRVQTDDGDDIGLGGSGHDELKGGYGDDILIAGTGNDIVDGEYGTDIVVGGAGNDVFRFISLDETVIITDFTLSEDRIELINMHQPDVTTGSQYGSLTINHPEGMNIVLLGISPALSIGDLALSFVTSETQTLFDPNA